VDALSRLRHLGAIHGAPGHSESKKEETLTEMGKQVSLLPMNPDLGKAMLVASMFGERTFSFLAISVLSYKEPFHMMGGKVGRFLDTEILSKTLNSVTSASRLRRNFREAFKVMYSLPWKPSGNGHQRWR
jgi:HrpA-like RNA helicase